MGEAMKIDEEVPMTIPNMIARPKPRMTSPPISASGRIDRTTVRTSQLCDRASD